MNLDAIWPWRKPILWTVGIVVAIIVLWLWMSASERRARDLAIAEEQKKNSEILAANNKEAQEIRARAEEQERITREANAALVKANLELVGTIRTTQAAREREAAVRQSQILKPKPLDEVVEEARKILGIEPKIQADGTANIAKESLQDYIALKDRLDSIEISRSEDQRQIRLLEDNVQRQQKTIESMEASLAAKDQTIREDKELIASQKEVIKSYEKVAKKGKLRRAAEISGKVGLTILAVYVGSQLAGAQ